MLSLFMWLLVTSVALSCIAIFITVRLRQRVSHDVEATFPTEKEHGYTETYSASSSIDGDLDTAKSGIPDAVTQSDIQREPWVLRTTSQVFGERHRGRHNVAVIKNDLEYHFNPENVVEKFLIKYHNSKKPWVVAYSGVIFREGRLINMGDGGILIGTGKEISPEVDSNWLLSNLVFLELNTSWMLGMRYDRFLPKATVDRCMPER